MAYIRILGNGIKSNPNINYAALADLENAGGGKTPSRSIGAKAPATKPATSAVAAKPAKKTKASSGEKAPAKGWFIFFFILTIVTSIGGMIYAFVSGYGNVSSSLSITLSAAFTPLLFALSTALIFFLARSFVNRHVYLILLAVAFLAMTVIGFILVKKVGMMWYTVLVYGIADFLVAGLCVLFYFVRPSFRDSFDN